MSLARYPLIAEWARIEDGRVVLRTGKVDIGQRITSALAQIAHEELGVPHEKILFDPVRTGEGLDEGITSGSNSLEQSGGAVRAATASLRRLLIEAAVARFGGAPDDWTVTAAGLLRSGGNRPVPIGDLAGDIDPRAPVASDTHSTPAAAQAPRAPMRGMRDLVRGRYIFIHDLEEPGMLHARVIRPPHLEAQLSELPAAVTEQVQQAGITLIRDCNFLALAGPDEWAVIKAAERLAARCDWARDAALPTGDIFTHLSSRNAVARLQVIEGVPTLGPLPAPLETPSHSARFEKPYLLHGALAPSAALAEWRAGNLRIFSHSQGIYPLRDSIAQSLQLDPADVVITHYPGSGCYGHNGADDAAFEAALIAQAIPDRPVLLKWSREDEHVWEPFGPAMAVDLAVVTDAKGDVSALSAEVFGDTHRGRPRSGPNQAGPRRLLANRLRSAPLDAPEKTPNMNPHGGLHRNLQPGYRIGETRLVKNLIGGLPHRTSALRCLGATANVFALECMMDELARDQGRDPLDYRRAHMDDARACAVLDRLAHHIDRLPAPKSNEGRGVAYAQYKNQMTRVGVCVDISVGELGDITLLNATIVADAGRVIDADGLCAQLEGGFIQGASWALCEEVTWDSEAVTSRDWESYPVLRFDNVPVIDIDLIGTAEGTPLGAGEASPGPTVAAIANALFDATGLRIRRLPLTADAILRYATAH